MPPVDTDPADRAVPNEAARSGEQAVRVDRRQTSRCWDPGEEFKLEGYEN
jgi:hypothetical protein